MPSDAPPQEHARWRFGAIVGEGLRNAAHGGARSTLLVGSLALLATLAVVAESSALQTIRYDETELWREGSHVVVASADNAVDGASCEAAATTEAVIAAGATRRHASALLVVNLGDAQLTLTEATAGVLRIGPALIPELPDIADPTLVIATPTADSLGFAVGETLEVRSHRGEVADVAPDATRDLAYATNRYATGLIAVVPPLGSFDTCLLLAAPGHLQTTISAVSPTVFLPNGRADADARPLLDTEQGLGQLRRQLTGRLTQWGGIAAGVLGGLFWTTTLLARRPEAGLYRSLGLANAELATLRLVEILAVSTLSLGLAALVSVIATQALGVDGDIAVWATLSTIQLVLLVQLVTAIVACPISWAGDPITLIKDR